MACIGVLYSRQRTLYRLLLAAGGARERPTLEDADMGKLLEENPSALTLGEQGESGDNASGLAAGEDSSRLWGASAVSSPGDLGKIGLFRISVADIL